MSSPELDLSDKFGDRLTAVTPAAEGLDGLTFQQWSSRGYTQGPGIALDRVALSELHAFLGGWLSRTQPNRVSEQ